MKKLFTPLTLIAFAGILFSSCSNSSKLAFTKRHYRNGYFADRIGKVKTVPAIARIPEKEKEQIIPSAITKPENPVILNVPAIVSQKEQLPAYRINLASAGKSIPVANNTSATNNLIQSPVLENKEAISASAGDDGGASERAALSLLWIVIVVVLILWLIGLLAGGWGLGGFINLLLVIALILLILWLLRIW